MNVKRANFSFLFLLLHALSAYGAVRYIDANSAAPVSPYTSWASAAKNFQDAVDASSSGDLILVTNGVYDVGGKLSGSLSNRVMVTAPLTLQSVNGPSVTIIQGTTNGPGPVRCVYLTNGATLIGFTLTNGATLQTGTGDIELSGGGVLGNGGGAVSNCVIIGNFAYRGGGAAFCTLDRCVIATNRSGLLGGGSYISSLKNCVLVGNSGGVRGGGDYYSTLSNCTMVGNRGPYGAGGMGSTFYNCIIYHNQWENWLPGPGAPEFCCTLPAPGGGYVNITNAPLFVNEAGGDFHLQANSPCINAGNNHYATSAVDFDGNPRIQGDTVDIGAFEFQSPTSVISYAWLQKYGLPTNGSADFIDTDGDSMNNWQEWRAGTDPTNPLSFLQLLKPIAGPDSITLTWQSGAGIAYFLQRSTNLSAQPLSVLQTDILGSAGTTTYTDTTATNRGPYFYRVGVQ